MKYAAITEGMRATVVAQSPQEAIRVAEGLSKDTNKGFDLIDGDGRVVASVGPKHTTVYPWVR
jgi:hypothetical protein